MRSAKAVCAAAAAVLLLGAGGCDFWNNLVEEKTAARADLEVKVVDAWTGDPLPGAACQDTLGADAADAADEQGVFRIQNAATGRYVIRCGHEWYYDGFANVHLTKDGAHAMVKLARRGLSDWYPDSSSRVAILQAKGQLRYPVDLDWRATPWDTTGKFRYEWTFLRSPRLNLGQLRGSEPLDPKAYSPRFRRRASEDVGVQAGPDTAILKVYSLLDGSRSGYLVDSVVVPIDWVQNRKPFIRFLAPYDSIPPTFHVGCANEVPPVAHVRMKGGDSDGACASIRFRSLSAPSMPIDTQLACVASPNYVYRVDLPFQRPSVPGDQNEIGQYVYDNAFVAEITDDNGEKGWDTLVIQTKTNAAPKVIAMNVLNSRDAYFFPGDPITVVVRGKDADGGVQGLKFRWSADSDGAVTLDRCENPESPPQTDSLVCRFTESFTQPGFYRSQGTAIDNCDDSESVVGPPLTIHKDNLPTFQIAGLEAQPTPGGDSLRVQFSLLVRDEDQDRGLGDSLTSVIISWASEGTQPDPTPGSSTLFKRTLAAPPAGSKLAIKIAATDAHSGQAETVLHVP